MGMLNGLMLLVDLVGSMERQSRQREMAGI